MGCIMIRESSYPFVRDGGIVVREFVRMIDSELMRRRRAEARPRYAWFGADDIVQFVRWEESMMIDKGI